MKITTIVLATALAISSGCALAAGASTGGTAAHGAAGTAGGSSGVRAGVSLTQSPTLSTRARGFSKLCSAFAGRVKADPPAAIVATLGSVLADPG